MTANLPHVLLVYQDADARRRLCELLEPLSLRITEVASGLEAIEILHTAIVDVIVTDINIGAFDCWRLARIIRSGIYRSDRTVPIIVVTRIWCERITEVTARDFGITSLLAFEDCQQLPQLVNAALENPPSGPVLPRVLVIEDHPDNARLVKKILRERFVVELAEDGAAGLAAWQAGHHDLVLLDVMLPKMSGSEVLDAILTQAPQQPVVIMTAHGTMDLAEQLMIRGAVDFIAKPFRPEQLRRVCELAARREDHLVTHQQFADRLEALQQLRDLLGSIINSMPSVLIGVDRAGRVTLWNQEAVTLTGVAVEQAQGQSLLENWPVGIDLSELPQALNDRQIKRRPRLIWIRNEKAWYYDLTIYPLLDGESGAVIRIDNVTDRVKLEERILQTERMSSLGQLAAGIANEINNPLAAILQNLQVVCNRLDVNLLKNQQVARYCGIDLENLACYLTAREITSRLEAVKKAGAQAAQLVEGMLGFNHQGSSISKLPTRLDDLIEKSLQLAASNYSLKRKFDFRSIKIIRDFQSLQPVHCDSGQIQQVLLSLLMNGAYAMEQKTLQLSVVERENYQPQFVLQISEANGSARVDIADNGTGIENELLGKIFEPFFSTKQVGDGIGLGLSLAYYIVTEDHKGQMKVSSTSGLGTRFSICLPLPETRF